MPARPTSLSPSIRRLIADLYARLDYRRLGPIYCDAGGPAFWRDRREPCRRVGTRLAEVLRTKLPAGGRSLYVGAGVAELPALVMEIRARSRTVTACNLRRAEVQVLNRACRDIPLRFVEKDAGTVRGTFDHLWMVSVLNDPERFPELAALSYGRADPVRFNVRRFDAERRQVERLAKSCLKKVSRPGLVTTSIEEVPWVADWCERNGVTYQVGRKTYPTALVGDPVCLIRLGRG